MHYISYQGCQVANGKAIWHRMQLTLDKLDPCIIVDGQFVCHVTHVGKVEYTDVHLWVLLGHGSGEGTCAAYNTHIIQLWGDREV